MQIRHARRGDEADLAFLLEDHERHYGAEVRPGAGAEGAEFLTEGGTLCLVADDGGKLVGFAILNPYFPGPRLTHGLFLKELYVGLNRPLGRCRRAADRGHPGAGDRSVATRG